MNLQGWSGPSDWAHHSFRHLAPFSGESPLAWPRLVALFSRALEVKQHQYCKYLGTRKILCLRELLKVGCIWSLRNPRVIFKTGCFFFSHFIHIVLFPLLLNLNRKLKLKSSIQVENESLSTRREKYHVSLLFCFPNS